MISRCIFVHILARRSQEVLAQGSYSETKITALEIVFNSGIRQTNFPFLFRFCIFDSVLIAAKSW